MWSVIQKGWGGKQPGSLFNPVADNVLKIVIFEEDD